MIIVITWFIYLQVQNVPHTNIVATCLLPLQMHINGHHGDEYCSSAHNTTPSTDDNNDICIGGNIIRCNQSK